MRLIITKKYEYFLSEKNNKVLLVNSKIKKIYNFLISSVKGTLNQMNIEIDQSNYFMFLF